MERDLTHFADRLEKETYPAEEVAKMLHNEADFTANKTKKQFDGMVSREDFDRMSTELDSVKTELKPYKTAEFDTTVSNEFTKLNGNKDRLDDFKKLSGLTGEEDSEVILNKVTEFKESGNYDFLFPKTDSGSAKTKSDITNSPKTPVKGMFTPKMGVYDLFK